MHGEYKVPGGKLVVVDLNVVDGAIADFHLSGDFFLEPDSALEAIDRAVNGLSAEADAAAYAAAVKSATATNSDSSRFMAQVSGWDRTSSRHANPALATRAKQFG